MRKSEFSNFHPAVNFVFFAVVLVVSMFSMNPVCIGVSFVCATAYLVDLKRLRALGFLVKFVLPVFVLTVAVNIFFGRGGRTVLCYFPWGSSLTLEGILYGLAAGGMMSAVLLWFACFSEVMTTDKLVFLFGKVTPELSLVLTMTLRFVPLFKERFKNVNEAQTALGRGVKTGGFADKMKNATAEVSGVVTLCMENAVISADSMKSRGYGTGKRTAYADYRLCKRDTAALICLCVGGILLIAGRITGALSWSYFPKINIAYNPFITITLLVIFMLICIIPVCVDGKEALTWKLLKSKT